MPAVRARPPAAGGSIAGDDCAVDAARPAVAGVPARRGERARGAARGYASRTAASAAGIASSVSVAGRYSSGGIRRAPRSTVPAAEPADWSRWLSPRSSSISMSPSGPAPEPDVHHRADQHAHHVVQEAVGLDVEAHAAAVRPLRPFGDAAAGSGSAAWARPWRRRRGSRARPCSSVAAALERGQIERPAERPFERPAERRGRRRRRCRCRSDSGGTMRALPRVEPGLHRIAPRATQQSRGSRALRARRRVGAVQLSGAGKLTPRPTACTPASVRPAAWAGRAVRRTGAPGRARTRLGPSGRPAWRCHPTNPVPSKCSVARKVRLIGPESSGARPPGQATQLLVTIDKSGLSRILFSTLPAPFRRRSDRDRP